MKTIITKLLMLTAVLSAVTNAYAYVFSYDFIVSGIAYRIISSTEMTVEVVPMYGSDYSGNVIIPERVSDYNYSYSVTSIGESAFNSCSRLTSVKIPNSVTTIGERAFLGCSSLASVTIHGSVTSIDDDAFKNCSGLKELTFEYSEKELTTGNSSFSGCCIETLSIDRNINSPIFKNATITNLIIGKNVTSIANNVFNGCIGLTSVTIPESVTTIGNDAFSGCGSIKSVNISDLSAWCKIDFSNVYSNPLIYAQNLYLDGELITDLTIPKDLTEIKQYVFSGYSGLTALTIPNNVTTIKDYAFGNCSGLKKLTFEHCEKVLTTGSSSFSDSNIETLYLDRNINCNAHNSPFYKVTITNLIIGKNITSIANNAFRDCSSITSVTMPENVTSIGNSAFQGCSALSSLTIGDNVNSIGDSAFSGCSSLAFATIPNSVTSVGDYAFQGCSALSTLTIGDNVNSIGDSAFSGCSSLASVTIPNSVTSIGYSVFQGCSTLSSLTIGDNVTTIGDYAFSGCSSLATVTIPNNVTSIGDYAFEDCDNLYSLIIGSGVSQIGEDAANPIKTIWLPNTPPDGYRNANGKVNYVANDLFTALSNVTVYPFISSLFEVDGVRYVPVVPSERTCDAIDCTYNLDISDFDLSKINYLGITMLVQNIQPYTFYRNAKIQNIIIPQNATSVGDYNFDGCTSLKYVTINDRETELELGSNGSEPLFVSCPLDTVYIGGNISYPTSSGQGYSPFYQNETLEKITIANVENAITEKEFYNCINLKDVSIGDDVEIIGDWAFSGCVVLNNFSFGSSMKEIGEEAFSDCIAMANITSKATVPPVCGWQALDDINKWNCTLTVPLSAVDSYKAAEQWKEFFFITGEDFDNTSGVDNVLGNNGLSVTTNRDCIEIIGADNAVITVYNINGQLVYNGTETTVGGLAQGIYIVCVGGQTFKVAL